MGILYTALPHRLVNNNSPETWPILIRTLNTNQLANARFNEFLDALDFCRSLLEGNSKHSMLLWDSMCFILLDPCLHPHMDESLLSLGYISHKFEQEEFIGGVVLVLHIAHVMMSDFGQYNCSVKNGYGSDWKLIRLSHQEDIPIQFIIGAAVTVGILLIVGLILLCICRQRVCGFRYNKGNRTKQPSRSSLQDYGVVNSDFITRAYTPNMHYRQDPYQCYSNNPSLNKSFARYAFDGADQLIEYKC
ncbi:unnamed protein product [Schistosoma margrebowiei]|uniref:Uncharacterized protein n=1 Tax=Schistosoma margrebowiei TaxID=48269 RepID=A0A3P7ZRM2_9TREM|nr:unnamed protein product [Schistosoma margrebowiei]